MISPFTKEKAEVVLTQETRLKDLEIKWWMIDWSMCAATCYHNRGHKILPFVANTTTADVDGRWIISGVLDRKRIRLRPVMKDPCTQSLLQDQARPPSV